MKRRYWIWLVTIIYIGIVFRFSAMKAVASQDLSSGFSWRILQKLSVFGLYGDVVRFDPWVRKCAHFAEYAVLGVLAGISVHTAPWIRPRLLNFAILAVSIPVIDETIQKFTEGRACMVSDMVLDACGYLFGGFLFYVLLLILKDLFRKR
ncbi:MAG: VanZ family protein [Solobacterium sp.]|nr:VanZ family protein [Solobacterium sp.]